ncbi:sensor histidine kinase [Planctomicrobium sp. SH664]|uniref:sensor histidine kinase n=1 Tax=Planctomicrobium sp. SH664 TaxID=3448125 RepID=UPI003F5C5E67
MLTDHGKEGSPTLPAKGVLDEQPDLGPLVTPWTDDAVRATKLAVQGGHVAVAFLVLLGIAGAIVKGWSVFSEQEIAWIAVLGAIYLGLNLKASILIAGLTRLTSAEKSVHWPSTKKIVLYFLVQLLLAGVIFHITRPARSIEALWLILLPPISHGVMVLPRWGLAIVCFAFIGIFSVNVLRLHKWRTLAEALPSFIYAVFFTLVYSQIAVNSERVRWRVERLAHELAEANRKLREYAMQVEELAIARERNRLAREIHDSVGHYLTVVNVQIAAAQAVMDRDPETGHESLRKAQSLTQEGLQEIRRSVAAFRSPPLNNMSLVECLRVLVSDSQHGNLQLNLQLLGTVRPLPPKTELTLFRAAQEALTNVEKHARASQVDLILDFRQADKVDLKIRDNGIGCDDTKNGGFGLISLRERARLLSGECRVATAPGEGLTLEIEVPG